MYENYCVQYEGYCVHGPYHGKRLAYRWNRCPVSQLLMPIVKTAFMKVDPMLPVKIATGHYIYNDLVEEWHWMGNK